jgi:hypothetical protein
MESSQVIFIHPDGSEKDSSLLLHQLHPLLRDGGGLVYPTKARCHDNFQPGEQLAMLVQLVSPNNLSPFVNLMTDGKLFLVSLDWDESGIMKPLVQQIFNRTTKSYSMKIFSDNVKRTLCDGKIKIFVPMGPWDTPCISQRGDEGGLMAKIFRPNWAYRVSEKIKEGGCVEYVNAHIQGARHIEMFCVRLPSRKECVEAKAKRVADGSDEWF